MTNCPDEEIMACYIDRLLSYDEIVGVEDHLLECERCREIVKITRVAISYFED